MAFHRTANDIRLHDSHILRARLKTDNRKWTMSEIDLDDIVGNDGGRFMWGGKSFLASAQSVTFNPREGTAGAPILHAELWDGDKFIPCTIDLSEKLINRNGSFSFEERKVWDFNDHECLFDSHCSGSVLQPMLISYNKLLQTEAKSKVSMLNLSAAYSKSAETLVEEATSQNSATTSPILERLAESEAHLSSLTITRKAVIKELEKLLAENKAALAVEETKLADLLNDKSSLTKHENSIAISAQPVLPVDARLSGWRPNGAEPPTKKRRLSQSDKSEALANIIEVLVRLERSMSS